MKDLLKQKSKFILAPLTFIFICTDILSTWHWYTIFGAGIEANPLGVFLLENSELLLLKAFLSAIILQVLDYKRDINILNDLRWLLFSCYLLLAIYHLIIYLKISSILTSTGYVGIIWVQEELLNFKKVDLRRVIWKSYF